MTYLETQLGPQNLTIGGPGPPGPPGSAPGDVEGLGSRSVGSVDYLPNLDFDEW